MRSKGKREELCHITAELKNIALELDISLLVIAQLNRDICRALRVYPSSASTRR